MRRPFDAVVFDLDGTLVDTEPLHRRSWEIVVAESGRPLADGDDARHVSGRPGRSICRDRFGMTPEQAAATTELVTARSWEIAAGRLTPLAGLVAWLERLAGLPRAVATSARRWSASRMLAELGMASAFDALVTADDVTHGKPHPESYLLAAERLAIRPRRCLAFEDAPSGLAAARAARMICVGVATSGRELPEADLVVHDYHDERLPALLAGELELPHR